MHIAVLASEPGRVTLQIEHGGAEGVMVADLYEEEGIMCFGITQFTGRIGTAPRRWLEVVRASVATIGDLARQSGCQEIRVAGRDWSKILPDFEPFEGPRNGLRKAL